MVIAFAIPTHWDETCGIETPNHIVYTPSSFTGSGLCLFGCHLFSLLHHVSRIGAKGKEDKEDRRRERSQSLAPIWFSNLACALLFNGRDWGRLSGKSRYGRLFSFFISFCAIIWWDTHDGCMDSMLRNWDSILGLGLWNFGADLWTV